MVTWLLLALKGARSLIVYNYSQQSNIKDSLIYFAPKRTIWLCWALVDFSHVFLYEQTEMGRSEGALGIVCKMTDKEPIQTQTSTLDQKAVFQMGFLSQIIHLCKVSIILVHRFLLYFLVLTLIAFFCLLCIALC